MPTTMIEMTDAQFASLRNLIYERSGIYFPENKKYILESRLTHRLSELEMDSYDHYLALLSMGPYQTDEFQEMFNRITINETSFFRNEPQLEYFERNVLSQLLESRKTSRRIRIWSAACSSGEEPYTLALMIHRTLGLRLPDWHVEILGTDISEKVLEQATDGRYPDYALRTTPPLVKQRYFSKDGNYWVLNEEIRKMVTFEKHNLKDRLAAKRHGQWDVIFCRNVLIYFDDAMKKTVLGMFHDQLAEDGYLMIGHSETIRSGDAAFSILPVPSAFCYQKTGFSGPKAS